ncbi:MAG: hypothetical protein AB1649_24995 [Chloroflexota bacterium]
METVVFKPKYNRRTYMGAILPLIAGLALIALDFRDIGYLAWGGLLCLASVVLFNAYPREIVFAQNEVVIKRWLFLSQGLGYQTFEGIKGASIVFAKGAIPLQNMDNAQDLISTVNRFVGNR